MTVWFTVKRGPCGFEVIRVDGLERTVVAVRPRACQAFDTLHRLEHGRKILAQVRAERNANGRSSAGSRPDA